VFSVHYVDRDILFGGTSQTLLFGVLLMVVWSLPNTVEIFWRVNPALIPAGYRPAPVLWPWRQNVVWAIGTGVVACLAIAGIDRVVEFIYFQF
jgi:hypothetical protein